MVSEVEGLVLDLFEGQVEIAVLSCMLEGKFLRKRPSAIPRFSVSFEGIGSVVFACLVSEWLVVLGLTAL